jgi:hypothetical protein
VCIDAWPGTADEFVTFVPAMFAREYLSVVSRWARDQLRREEQTPDNRRHLRQLIDAAEALRAELPVASDIPADVVSLADYTRAARSRSRGVRLARFKNFLDG